MRNDRRGNAKLRSLTLLFAVILVLPAATLIVLGLLLLDQDKTITAQHVIERRDLALDRAVNALELQLADLERLLDTGSAPEGAVRLVASLSGIEAHPARLVPWLPEAHTLPEADESSFQEAQAQEFRGAAEKALAIHETNSRAGSAAVKAGALIRMARVHRRAGRVDSGAYDYVTKPFSLHELRARIRAMLRRTLDPAPASCRFGDCEVDFDRAELCREGKPLEITAQELKLLSAFVRNRTEFRVYTETDFSRSGHRWIPRSIEFSAFLSMREISPNTATTRISKRIAEQEKFFQQFLYMDRSCGDDKPRHSGKQQSCGGELLDPK